MVKGMDTIEINVKNNREEWLLRRENSIGKKIKVNYRQGMAKL